MSPDDLRLLVDIHAGLLPFYEGVWVEQAGDRVQVILDASDLPADPRTLIDAMPGLLADSAKLAALEVALDDMRAKLVENEAASEKTAAEARDPFSRAMASGEADAFSVAQWLLDAVRPAIPPGATQATAVGAGRGGRLGGDS